MKTLKFKIIYCLIVLFQLFNCQDKENKNMPIYNVEISHPNSNYLVTPIEDSIITLDGTKASLPYGSTSGEWGSSGKMFTEQVGTPIGVDIVYFSRYEDTFYHLKAHFPIEKMKDLSRRAYASNENTDSDKSLKEFIYIDEELNYDKEFNSMTITYNPMNTLIFGFAPKGMVVVWVGYGYNQKEVGRFQAEVVKDDKKYAHTLFSKISQTRQDIKNNMFIPDASPELWDNYRQRYNWSLGIISENKNFRAFQMIAKYYNAEIETMLRLWINQPNIVERALPKEISFFGETGKNQAFEGAVFFDWSKTNEAFKKVNTNSKLELKIAEDNNSFEVLLNGEKLSVDSMRIYRSNFKFKDSYK